MRDLYKRYRRLDCTHHDKNMKKLSIGCNINAFLLFSVGIRVYLVNNELSLAAKVLI